MTESATLPKKLGRPMIDPRFKERLNLLPINGSFIYLPTGKTHPKTKIGSLQSRKHVCNEKKFTTKLIGDNKYMIYRFA